VNAILDRMNRFYAPTTAKSPAPAKK